MIKCFLSHSSNDKESYVRIMASHIKKEAKIFDEETFEEGMSPIEEVVNGIDQSTLFVILISNSALDSKWVHEELNRAKSMLDSFKIERIYPIIIESGISYNDPRIPDWMRDSFNIQAVLKPSIAARKINSRLTELAWTSHPKLKERREIFVGRNNLIKQIEERLDDFSKKTPVVLICSGLPSIGRKSLLQHALRKSNIVRESYEFPIVSLSSFDGIEDFILKIYDLGFVSFPDLKSALNGTFDKKLQIAKNITSQIIAEKERIIIEDSGVLIQNNGEIIDWFIDIVNSIEDSEHLTFGIASKFRPKYAVNWKNELFYTLSVTEMDVSERNGLLRRYSTFHALQLSRDDYLFFSDILTGYPEQVLFTVDLINDQGVFQAKRLSHTIQQYGSDKARVVLDSFKSDAKVLEFIYFLSKFEFISYDVLFDIVSEELYYPIIERLLVASVCERIGASSDYVRVNEVVRDYISRSRFGNISQFDDEVKKHVNSFLSKYKDDNYDVSDYIFSAQESLRSGETIPNDLIIPSVFLKTIKKLYDDDRNYTDAIILADRVLQKEKYLHKNTIEHIRYIKCQCLARLRKSDFFTEARKISEPDRSFLHGFYYRLSGQYTLAEENLNRALNFNGRRNPKVIGELILVYM